MREGFDSIFSSEINALISELCKRFHPRSVYELLAILSGIPVFKGRYITSNSTLANRHSVTQVFMYLKSKIKVTIEGP